MLVRNSTANRGHEATVLQLTPTLWCRNDWPWKTDHPRPRIAADPARPGQVQARHRHLEPFALYHEPAEALLFTENESNGPRLWGLGGDGPFKDAFDDAVVHGRAGAVNPAPEGSKFAPHYRAEVSPGETWTVRLQLGRASWRERV